MRSVSGRAAAPRRAALVAPPVLILVSSLSFLSGFPLSARAAVIDEATFRKEFLEVENFARLPHAEQVKGLAAFYRAHSLGSFVNLMTSVTGDIFDREVRFTGGDPDELYAQQLAQASATMTPEEAANKIGSMNWLNVAAHARTVQVLKMHGKELYPIVLADLESPDQVAFQRASCTIAELRLTTFSSKVLEIYLGDGPRASEAHSVLAGLNDPEVVKRLHIEVERDPKTLVRHAELFQVPLAGKPADPLFMKYLSAEDANMRFAAATALMACRDAALAKPIAALSKDTDARLREMAALMVDRLPNDAFASIRTELLPLLHATEPATQRAAIKAFAGHKDMAVAPVIRELLAAPPANPKGGYDVTVLQSLRTLTGQTFGYNLITWGLEKNAAAIARFDQWIANQQGKDSP